MGIEPKEEDYLVDLSDMFPETNQAFEYYSFLPERWEGMNGVYLGKDYTLLPYLFDLNGNDKVEQKYMLNIIKLIDGFMAESIAKKQKAASKKG